MFDIGWSEMALILMVALVVVGPKDLPRVARQIGKWTAKARSMGREFQRAFDDMAREAELQDLKAEIQKVSRTDMRAQIEQALDPGGEMKRAFEPPSFESPKPAALPEPAAAAVGEPPSLPEAESIEFAPAEAMGSEPRMAESVVAEPKTAEKV